MHIHVIKKREITVDQWDPVAVQNCISANIRRTDRAITQYYDAILAPSGVHITQFTLMAMLAVTGPMTINRFAEHLLMDRTTLTRNLGPVTKQGWVRVAAGEDRRTRIVALTPEGEQVLERTLPLWKQAHAHMLNGLGKQHIDTLLTNLSALVALSQ